MQYVSHGCTNYQHFSLSLFSLLPVLLRTQLCLFIRVFFLFLLVTFAFKYHNESVSEQWWANRKFLVPVVAIVLIYPWLYLRKIGILSYTR